MRSPTQVRLESAPDYRVGRPFKADDREYLRGDYVDGDLARSWPTFRVLVGNDWLVLPDTAAGPATPSTSTPKLRRRASSRRDQ